MSRLRYVWIQVLLTCLRLIPFKTKTGLWKIGSPGRQSPVLLTCNYRLTVERVKKAVQGEDVYLLVANSRGVNVWCAATGGLLTHHDVVSALKTSGVESVVDHRQVVLPQLAATGIEAKVVHEKTGWTIRWGPVRAEEIPPYLKSGLVPTRRMRTVRFAWPARMEMAIGWAFPMSLVALVGLFWRPIQTTLLICVVWGLSLLIFGGFPLYAARLRSGGRTSPWRQVEVAVASWCVAMAALAVYGAAVGSLSLGWTSRWGVGVLVLSFLLCVDLMGSTPIYKSGTHEDRRLRITLDLDACTGVGVCEQVCPTDVFDVDRTESVASLGRAELCVQCGACIVQCPQDALGFLSPDGSAVTPETVRKFKLNLMGKRTVRSHS